MGCWTRRKASHPGQRVRYNQALSTVRWWAGTGAGDVKFQGGRVVKITDQSGHYFPWLEDNTDSFLLSGVDAFRNAGISVPNGAIQKFGW